MTKKKTKQKKSLDKDLVPVIESKQLGSIKFNFEETKEKLSQKLDHYKDYEVTEETLSEDKKERAKLNKVSKAINRMRIDAKKELSKPITEFEDKMKELAGMVDETVDNIGEQIKEYDEKRKEEKIELAKNIVAEQKELSDLPEEWLDRVEFKDFYSNLSASTKEIEDDVTDQIENLEKEYEVKQENRKVIENKIEKVNKDIEGKLYPEDYINKLNDEETSLSDVLTMIDDRVEKIKEEEKPDEPEEKKEEPKEKNEDQDDNVDGSNQSNDGELAGEEIRAELVVIGTKDQLNGLKEYMVDNNINFELKKNE